MLTHKHGNNGETHAEGPTQTAGSTNLVPVTARASTMAWFNADSHDIFSASVSVYAMKDLWSVRMMKECGGAP